jgi:hypothetical protein
MISDTYATIPIITLGRELWKIYEAIITATRAFPNKIHLPHHNKKIEELKKRFHILEKEFERLTQPLLD